jgi:hypothetical protein
MRKKPFIVAGVIVLTALLINFQIVFAHEGVTVGDYELEIGWLNEPPVVDQQNAIVVIVTDTSGGGSEPVEDVSALTVTISYGGQNKTLTLQPLGEDTPGQFVAPILPTVAGLYTINLGGTLGDTTVDAAVEPEEVQPSETLQFPVLDLAQPTGASSSTDWLTWLGVLLGLIGIGLGITAMRKTH